MSDIFLMQCSCVFLSFSAISLVFTASLFVLLSSLLIHVSYNCANSFKEKRFDFISQLVFFVGIYQCFYLFIFLAFFDLYLNFFSQFWYLSDRIVVFCSLMISFIYSIFSLYCIKINVMVLGVGLSWRIFFTIHLSIYFLLFQGQKNSPSSKSTSLSQQVFDTY